MKALDFGKNVEIILKDMEEVLGEEELMHKIAETIGTEKIVNSIGREEIVKSIGIEEIERLLAELKKQDQNKKVSDK